MPPIPNSVRASRPSRAMLAIGVLVYAFMVLGGVVLLAFGAARGWDAARIGLGPTSRITASVIDRSVDEETTQTRSGPSSVTKYDVYYAFRPPGAGVDYIGIDSVSPDEYARVEVGSSIDVEYLSGDPTRNWPAGHSPLVDQIEAAVFGLVLGVGVLVVTQWRFGIRGFRDAWRAAKAR